MPRRPTAAAVVTAATLLTASACLARAPEQARDPLAASDPTDPNASSPPPGLTETQARAALIGEADLGAPWKPSEGAATWRDGMLKATTNAAPDCQRLLEALYTEELLGPPSGSRVVAALDDGDDQAQLRYQIAAHPPADVDRVLAWLRTLPGTCGEFQATTTRSGVEAVQVAELALPTVGDARQGLRVTLTGETDMAGNTPVLTLEVAAVRVADETIVLTDGALGAVPPQDSTRRALDVGAQRLTQIRDQARAQA
ncbi:hypothetical protein ABZX30_07020 [Streptomyces sp. NPDC004542]|uniref:hypothetical protein n=1 Tax=Streptomyces sp. NPDC004542 TaxID=3154281 RepID=UPI00339F9A40